MNPSLLLVALAMIALQAPQGSSFYADHGYPGFGMTVGKAGDVNGDGLPDLLIGDDGLGDEAIPPAVWIVSGKDGAVLRFLTIPAQDDCVLDVDGGIDFDGDRVPDVLACMRPLPPQGQGRIYIISGESGSILRCIATPGPASGAGHWARVVGDIDKDGTPDVGSLCLETVDKPGMLYIYSGMSGSQITTIPVGDECTSGSGSFIAVGDIDADGGTDFAVVTDGARKPEERHAALRLYSGAKKTRLWEHLSAQTVPGSFGAITILGDLDKDGIPEIASSFFDCVDVVSGRSGKLVYHLGPRDKTDSEMGYGYALATIGDIDGDKVLDFALTETESGAFTGMVRARSGRDGREIWNSDGGFAKEIYHLGYELAALGDVDRDGVSDLAVGTYEVPSGEPGLARVLSGRDGSLVYQFRRKGDDVVVTRRAPKAEKTR